MNNPFFSIIIPTYNRAHIVNITIESVLKQSYTDWELIIVDDGSTDNTKNVVNAIQDERIHYIFQINAERSAARNNGIRNAKGKYICFLDSDDLYEENHLETLYSNIQEKNVPIALFFVHANHYINKQKITPALESLENNALLYFFTHPVIPARVCIHNEILKKIQFDEDIVIVEDLVLWVKIAFSYPVHEIKAYTVCYALHDDNSVNLKNNSYIIRYNGIKLFFSRYPEIKNNIPYFLRQKVISDTLFGVARYYNFMENYFKMVNYLILSILYFPIHKQTKAKFHMILFPGKHRITKNN